MLDEWLQSSLTNHFEEHKITISPGAMQVFRLACMNQLESNSVASEEQLVSLLSKMGPGLVPAYRAKYGVGTMTFGRAVRFIGDAAERWKELRAQAATSH